MTPSILRRHGRLLTAALLVLGSACSCLDNAPATPAVPAPEPAAAEDVILLTGFEPFGGLKSNTSWEVAKSLNGEKISGMRVVAVRLPVVWQECSDQLHQAVAEHEPRIVVATGVSGRNLVQVESVARNERRPYPDNRKALPADRVIEAGAPAKIDTSLPVQVILKRLQAAGVPAGVSDDAGGYLCNEAFYSLMRSAETLSIRVKRPVTAGFVHMPVAVDGPDARPGFSARRRLTLTQAQLRRAVRAILEVTAAGARESR